LGFAAYGNGVWMSLATALATLASRSAMEIDQ
jgi:hypothetical protein